MGRIRCRFCVESTLKKICSVLLLIRIIWVDFITDVSWILEFHLQISGQILPSPIEVNVEKSAVKMAVITSIYPQQN